MAVILATKSSKLFIMFDIPETLMVSHIAMSFLFVLQSLWSAASWRRSLFSHLQVGRSLLIRVLNFGKK